VGISCGKLCNLAGTYLLLVLARQVSGVPGITLENWPVKQKITLLVILGLSSLYVPYCASVPVDLLDLLWLSG